MNEEIRLKLESVGIDTSDLLDRLMGNMTLISRFCNRFPEDVNYGKMMEAIERGDTEAAFQGAHSLKGVSANLSMKGLLRVLSPVVEKLRAGELDGVKEMLPAVTEQYEKVVDAIQSIEW